jgi:hypothetical protein
VIIDCGRAFEFLSWYRPLTLAEARREKPSLDWLRGDVFWTLKLPGTCSATHFKRMELEKIGNLAIDPGKLGKLFPGLRPGISAAVSDISLGNRLHSAPHGWPGPDKIYAQPGVVCQSGAVTMIFGIEQILRP